jgi:glycerol-3-phosphate dehydrogenase
VLSLIPGGAALQDEMTGAVFELRAKMVVNAAGVWAGQLDHSIKLRPSRGTHLVLPSELFGNLNVSLNIPIAGDIFRYILVLPQADGRTYVGLTDEPVDGGPVDVPKPTDSEVDFLLDSLGGALRTSISRADVIGTFAGLRPLLAGGGRTADLSRRHAVRVAPTGAVTIVGGKLTTYRRMAEDAVNRALEVAGFPARPCLTRNLPLVGAAPRAQLALVDAPNRLVARYGTEAPLVAAGDLTPVAEGLEVSRAELDWAVQHEGALDESDLLDRRTRIGLVPADRAAAMEAACAALH